MSVRKRTERRQSEKMSGFSFRLMDLTFRVVDFFFHRYIDKRIKNFGIREGMTVVDYGCGPGRYTIRFSQIVGEMGKVYAVDIHELAVEAVERKIAKNDLENVKPVLVSGYNSGLPDHCADVVCAVDMFFGIKKPGEFLGELKRIAKSDGILVVDDGHQSREETRKKILASGHWAIWEETKDHLKCKPA
ncbi:MAG: class I SAM-dependent methyltransferase [Spirochaetaceae bacterium]|nr:class I SAM-dependent methyltransferase [Spirochaetaceae bacterium]